MFYIVGCDYLDEDNTMNSDPLAGVFTDMQDTLEFTDQIKADGCTHISITFSESDPFA